MRRLLGVLSLAILAVTAVQAQSYITLSADTSYATGSPDEIHKAGL